MNDEISSIELLPLWEHHQYAVFYEHRGYEGYGLVSTGDQAFFLEGNDEASSIKLINFPQNGYLRIFPHTDFLGNFADLHNDIAQLSNIDFNDKISSFQFREMSGGCEAILYKDKDFQGSATTYNDHVGYVGDPNNDEFSSVKISHGCYITLFEDANFQGQSVSIYNEAS